MSSQNTAKQAAARAALEFVEPGKVLGVGTGSTVNFLIDELRAHADDALDGLLLLKRGNRLSITPISDAHWEFILSLE